MDAITKAAFATLGQAPPGRQEPCRSRRPQNGFVQLDGRRATPG